MLRPTLTRMHSSTQLLDITSLAVIIASTAKAADDDDNLYVIVSDLPVGS